MKIKAPHEICYLVWLLILAGCVVAAEILVERWLGSQTISPLLSILAMGVIALKFSWRYVLFAAAPFCFLSYWLIEDASKYPVIRTITVGAGGCLAAWASFQRSRLDNQVQEFEAVLKNLPMPWLLSNSQGTVMMASAALANLSGKTPADLVGMLHFAVLAVPDSSGSEIFPTKPGLKNAVVQIHPFLSERSTKTFLATYIPVAVHGEHCLLTILKDS